MWFPFTRVWTPVIIINLLCINVLKIICFILSNNGTPKHFGSLLICCCFEVPAEGLSMQPTGLGDQMLDIIDFEEPI